MRVWYCIPSARPAAEVRPILLKWQAMGYKTMVWRDEPPCESDGSSEYTERCAALGATSALFMGIGNYPGYAAAVNRLVRFAMKLDETCGQPQADWFVTGGDDVEPHGGLTADTISYELGRHFGEVNDCYRMEPRLVGDVHGSQTVEGRFPWSTFGVMQPTGDRWQDTPFSRQRFGQDRGAPIDRVAGSPWMGREFCERMYEGKGPLFPGYKHMFVDEELQEVATKLGVFYQRRDLTHLHRHYIRMNNDTACEPPAHLKVWTSQAHWDESKALFEARKAAGFPGHEPL